MQGLVKLLKYERALFLTFPKRLKIIKDYSRNHKFNK